MNFTTRYYQIVVSWTI